MKIPHATSAAGAGPVPTLLVRTAATRYSLLTEGRPRVAPLQCFFIRGGEREDHGNLMVRSASPLSSPRHKDTKNRLPANFSRVLLLSATTFSVRFGTNCFLRESR